MSAEPSYRPGYNFGGERAGRVTSRLVSIARDNKRRVPCELCGLGILPEGMSRHLEIVHDVQAPGVPLEGMAA